MFYALIFPVNETSSHFFGTCMYRFSHSAIYRKPVTHSARRIHKRKHHAKPENDDKQYCMNRYLLHLEYSTANQF